MVSEKIRLERLKLSMAEEIFSIIDLNRDYLGEWLPFIEFSKQISDTEKFIQSILNQHQKNRKDRISFDINIWSDAFYYCEHVANRRKR